LRQGENFSCEAVESVGIASILAQLSVEALNGFHDLFTGSEKAI